VSADHPHVVVVGAGFGGLSAVQALKDANVDVTLVDRRNHHVFQPLLYQVATAALSPADIAAPTRSILSRQGNARVLLETATGIDARGQTVHFASGRQLRYDWLILATGARHSYFGRDHWARHAPGIKTLDDATAARRSILLALERAETESDQHRRRSLLTFVVIGGGPTGVELAGAIAELMRRTVSRDFRSITPHCARVILIEAGPRLLPSFPEDLSEQTRRNLEQLGVDVRLGKAVDDLGPGHVRVGIETIDTHTIIWAAGVKASPAAAWLGTGADGAGRIIVDPDLRVRGQPHVFAIGDTACCPGPDGRPLPGIAPVAKQQGRHVAAQILGRTGEPFRYRDAGILATIGRRRAVAALGTLHLTGFAAWLMWSVAHIWFLIGFRNRLTVSASWLWNYFTFERSARLITGDAETHVDVMQTLEAA